MKVIDHLPIAAGGAAGTCPAASRSGAVRRQVYDIPVVPPVVIQHRRRRCGYGRSPPREAPAGMAGPVQYGPSLRALAVYLLVFHHVQVARAAH